MQKISVQLFLVGKLEEEPTRAKELNTKNTNTNTNTKTKIHYTNTNSAVLAFWAS